MNRAIDRLSGRGYTAREEESCAGQDGVYQRVLKSKWHYVLKGRSAMISSRSRYSIFMGRRINSPRIIGAVFMLFGILFLVIGMFVLIEMQHFLQRATSATTAVVVECFSTGKGSCTPVLKFETASGETITVTSSFSSSGFEVGQQVQVVYNPHNPHEASISSFMALWFLPSIFLGIGGLFFLIGGGIAIVPLLLARGVQGSMQLNPDDGSVYEWNEENEL
jgi:hypothetical protein